MNYRKKPAVIQAIQYFDTVESMEGLSAFMPDPLVIDYAIPQNPVVKIQTLEGTMQAQVGDWIIKGVKGEFYPCKPDIFEMTYETAPEPGDLPEVENAVPEWKRRVLNEHADLSDKVEKLHAFLSNGNDHELPEAELDRLCQQRDLMRQYRGVLEARINAFAA